MGGGAIIFARRVQAENLRKILDMDALPVCPAIKTPHEQNQPLGKCFELFGYPLELVSADQFPLGHVHADCFGKREVRKLVFRHARKGGRGEFCNILALVIPERQGQPAALAGVLHHRELHLHACQREASLGPSLGWRHPDAGLAVTGQHPNGPRQIRTKGGQEIEIIPRPHIARMVFFHRLAQPVFGQQVGKEGRQAACDRSRILAQAP